MHRNNKHKSLVESIQVLDKFFSYFNGRLWIHGYIEYWDNLGDFDINKWVEGATASAMAVLLPRMPPIPSAGKWDKLLPGVSFILLFPSPS